VMEVAKVGVIMGNNSDWETMQHACNVLDELDISYEKEVISAHRTPDDMFRYAETARERDINVIIARTGDAAHWPDMTSSNTTRRVIVVPVQSKALDGMDSLLSIVQMPGGVPTATMAIGKAGATNAGLYAAQILSVNDTHIAVQLDNYRKQLTQKVEEMREDLAEK